MKPRKPYGSVKKLADELGINRVYLSAVLLGAQIPSVALAKKISRATGRSFFDFRPDLKDVIINSL
jgi:transcriptional regulator with XRE-family HTH domain